MEQYHYDLIKTLQDKFNGVRCDACADVLNNACNEVLRSAPNIARQLSTQELNFGINPHKACGAN